MFCFIFFSYPSFLLLLMQPGRNVKKRRFDPSQQGPIWRNVIQKAASCTTGFWVWYLCCGCAGTKSMWKNIRNNSYDHSVGMLGNEKIKTVLFGDKFKIIPPFTFLLLTLTDKHYKQFHNQFVFFSFSQTKEETHRPSTIRELFQNNEIAKDFFPSLLAL